MSAQGKGNQAGGLPALAAEVEALKAQVAALQSAISVPSYPDVYAKTYKVIIVESNSFGCNTTNDPAEVLSMPGGLLRYLQNQGISSRSTLSSVIQVESDGYTCPLYIET